MAIEVIEWKDDSGREMVWRFAAGGELKLGAQLVVSENQWAIFFRDGKALDTFGPGRHTLTTGNIPLLGRLIGLPFGGTSPFRADVYYVARKVFTGLKWGTQEPLVFRDSELAMVRLRAFGTFAIRIADPQMFVNQIVGSQGRTTSDGIETFLRSAIVMRLSDVLGETVKTLFDLPKYYDELGEALKGRVAGDLQKYGVDLTDFFIGGIVPPEEVQKVIDERTGMAAVGDQNAYLKFKAAQALGDAAKNPSGAGAATTGVGLGAGVGLGMSMAQMMKDAMSSGGTSAAPATGGAPGTATAGAFCTACGTRFPDGAKFCPSCGAKRA
ncbi:MAG TPA: SPFH domain-containing protein [Candidatus Sulfotelmatobacter sp.]|jgi:membrane protease subunit (stomatin/prohibitin family)|nr:SPFH domain-containing protein [Candidatus Sulfotelmatobacter sp.]